MRKPHELGNFWKLTKSISLLATCSTLPVLLFLNIIFWSVIFNLPGVCIRNKKSHLLNWLKIFGYFNSILTIAPLISAHISEYSRKSILILDFLNAQWNFNRNISLRINQDLSENLFTKNYATSPHNSTQTRSFIILLTQANLTNKIANFKKKTSSFWIGKNNFLLNNLFSGKII